MLLIPCFSDPLLPVTLVLFLVFHGKAIVQGLV
jgi:hypothetical protein